MTTQFSNSDFTDLYGDALVKVIELNEEPSFDTIKTFFSELETMEKEFSFNGKRIIAKRKFTYRGGGGKMFQVKTNYLHVWVQTGKSENSMTHYKENKSGQFETV